MTPNTGTNQGRKCPASHAATVACYLGLWRWATAPFRFLTVEEWMAVVMVLIALGAVIHG